MVSSFALLISQLIVSVMCDLGVLCVGESRLLCHVIWEAIVEATLKLE